MKKEGRCDDAYRNAVDEWRNEESGAGPLVETRHMQYTDDSISTWTVTPHPLLDGGNQFDDIGVNGRYNRQRRYNYLSRITGRPLPRERLHSHVADTGLTRPNTTALGASLSLIKVLLSLLAGSCLWYNTMLIIASTPLLATRSTCI